MSYVALYREWRPQSFGEMVGQEHVTRTLQNALRSNRFAHAYLFSGPRGTGKTSTAKILAKAINCENRTAEEPCNNCPSCRGITEGSIMDVVEIDAASNRGVDEIRDLREQVKYAPTEVKHKVYIIDEVHMLTTEAFNALLKTLEEPPSHVMFILATTEPHKIPATIISRCQRFDFRRISGRQIVDRLQHIAQEKQIDAEDEALWLVSRAAEGGMRDALSIFDQVISYGGDKVTVDSIVSLIGGVRSDILGAIAKSVSEKDVQKAIRLTEDLVEDGKDVAQILHDLTLYFRDLLMLKTVPNLEDIRDRVEHDKTFQEVAELFSTSELISMIDHMTETAQEMKWHNQGRLLLEMLIVRLCKTESADVTSLLKRIDSLEQKLANGVPLVAASAANQSQALPNVQHTVPTAHSARLAEKPASVPVKHEVKPSQATAGTTAGITRPVDKLIKNPSKELFDKINTGWSQILDEVKRRKITAQAWLLDGEPVAVDSGNVLVAFKNQIHRDTVMKPIHKAVIDEVFSEFLGTASSLQAVLQSDWQKFKQQGAEEMAATSENDLANEVIRIFGQEIVEIQD